MVLAAMQVWQFRVAVTSTELLTSSGQSVSASVSRSALWVCPRPKIGQRASVWQASSSFPSMSTPEFFTRSHVEVSASLGCGFWSMLVCSTSEFPRRRPCAHHLDGGRVGGHHRRHDVRGMAAHGGNSGGLAGPRLALGLQGLVMCSSANVGAKRSNPSSINLFQLEGLDKAFIGKRTGEEGVIPCVCAVVVCLFCSRKRSMQKSLHHDSDVFRCGVHLDFV